MNGCRFTALVQRLNCQVSRHARLAIHHLFPRIVHARRPRLDSSRGQTPPLLRGKMDRSSGLMRRRVALGMFEGSTYEAGELP
jgi:hypothetical protein